MEDRRKKSRMQFYFFVFKPISYSVKNGVFAFFYAGEKR